MIAARVTLALVLSFAPEVPPEARDEARTEAARGEVFFADGQFDEASDAYRRAYELDPFPPFLFARARSEQEAGRCESAIEIYRSFLATDPPAADVDRANLEIGRCYGRTRPTVTPAPAPVVAPTPAPVSDQAPRAPTGPRAWYRDPVGGGLFGAGLVVLATGLGLFFAGESAESRAHSAATTDAFRERIHRAQTLDAVGIAGISVGSSLVTAAIVRYAIIAAKARRARRSR